MKPWQFIVSIVLSALCLVTALTMAFTLHSARGLQAEYQNQQVSIDRARLGQQTVNGIVQDMVKASGNNAVIREFLQQNGLAAPAAAKPEATPASSQTPPPAQNPKSPPRR